MALKHKMTVGEMISFIDRELIPQTKHEIQNLIYPQKKTGGYFVVTRQILCIVDFLGAVYSGYPRRKRERDKKENKERIATSNNAKKFITTFFEPSDVYKRNTVNKFYHMYRHGLVHLYQPRILVYKKGTLEWFLYRGKRHQDKISINDDILIANDVDHLKILQFMPDKNRYHLAICIDALYDDFEHSVSRFKSKLQQSPRLQTNWRTAVNAICEAKAENV